MIDLSFLTKEEQETVRAVLKRDAEEQRVQNLQKTVRLPGAEIIRASMRHFHKALTISEASMSCIAILEIPEPTYVELSQMISEKPCSFCNEMKCSSHLHSVDSFKSSSVMRATTISSLKQMKTGVSITVHQATVTALETNWRRNTGSSPSNFSLSSGMTSVSGSICSLYPEGFKDLEVQGSIQFALNYIQLKEFHIFLMHCRDLAVADNKNCSDPYVKCYLLPHKTKLGRKTTVKKTLNLTYNEILRFKILLEVFKTQSLNISVWHSNTFGRNNFMGEVDLDMSDWDFNNTHLNEYALKGKVSGQSTRASPTHLMDSREQMRVALRFLPQISTGKRTSWMETGELQILVKDCKNLPPVREIVTDPFVKCILLDTSRKNIQKRVVKRAANPMFNHTMVWLEHLKEACVEMTVWDHDRLNHHFFGGLRLGLGTGRGYEVDVVWMDSTTDEAKLWHRMLHSNGEWVEDDLPLRMLIMVKKKVILYTVC
ncbi:LOW QUALITY PROTEIN: synaptotagmin-like protein 2 [Spinachia spinachia]